MCTCGIDMATQQPTPAKASMAIRAVGLRPSASLPLAPSPLAAARPAALTRRRMTRVSGIMVARQTKAMMICDARQPVAAISQLTIGGQMAPPR